MGEGGGGREGERPKKKYSVGALYRKTLGKFQREAKTEGRKEG